MTTQEKGKLIGEIIANLKFAKPEGKVFDEGDTFFSLCFKSDEELIQIAKLANV